MNYKFQEYIKKQESDFLKSKVNSDDLIRISDAQNYLNSYNKHLTLQGVMSFKIKGNKLVKWFWLRVFKVAGKMDEAYNFITR